MSNRTKHARCKLLGLIGGFAICCFMGLSGCQVDMGGQTLPSPYYMQDDVQYFAPGPEMKLAREAAALKAAQAEAQR